MPTVILEWWGERGNVAALYRWLADQGRIHADEISTLIEKPWKFTAEWREYLADVDAPTAA